MRKFMPFPDTHNLTKVKTTISSVTDRVDTVYSGPSGTALTAEGNALPDLELKSSKSVKESRLHKNFDFHIFIPAHTQWSFDKVLICVSVLIITKRI